MSYEYFTHSNIHIFDYFGTLLLHIFINLENQFEKETFNIVPILLKSFHISQNKIQTHY